MAQLGTTQMAPIAEKVSGQDPDEYQRFSEKRWQTGQRISDFVTELVTDGTLEPVEAASITAAVVGVLFGYRQFHGDLAPADITQALLLQTSFGTGSGRPVGGRQ